MNKDAVDARLGLVIDQALNSTGLESLSGPSETIEELFSAVTDYLALPVNSVVRSAASHVAELSRAVTAGHTDAIESDEDGFRSALAALRSALEVQREEDASARQLASDPELVQEFLVEARAHLSCVESGILLLEREPENSESLNAVFRSFHTIKGLSGFLGAAAVHELAHETENLLDLARAGKLSLSSEIVELILRSADQLNICLDRAGRMPLNELPRCDVGLLSALAAVTLARSAVAAPAESPVATPLPAVVQETVVEHAQVLPADEAMPRAEPIQSTEPIQSSAQKTEAAVAEAGDAASSANSGKGGAEGSFVRIETSKLEYLIDMVGELVIAESVVRHDPAIAGSREPLLSRNVTQLSRVVQEVQKTSMAMRMVSVGALFRKMSRLTRDLARKSGKQLELVTIGDDVELDRSIVEELADPMVHMIRNAVDHGLELPEERKCAGKNVKGTVRLNAMHDAGDIVIEVSDDGRGMDPAKILAKARRQGLVADNETPDEEAIFRCIFEAGFSTAEKVTEMSGRGVGMDVVKKQIQKLRGRVAIRSVLGKGSTFVLRLPLTLAIIDGLVVGVGSQRYILPMFAIREMFSPGSDTFVTLENRVEAVLFRDRLLPLIRLSKLLPVAAERPAEAVLIVVEGRDQLYCVAVDQLIGKQEVVIKSLGTTFRDIPAISGGAILGDGRVGLIIDVNSLRYQN
jgi:two-component system chemotaxis sensor kinase CheA